MESTQTGPWSEPHIDAVKSRLHAPVGARGRSSRRKPNQRNTQRYVHTGQKSQGTSLTLYLNESSFISKTEQEAQLMLTNPRDAFRGRSRSPNMVLFDIFGMVSYQCAIVTLTLNLFTARRLLARHLLWKDGCLAGWLIVTRRYCIKTVKPILKLFGTIW